MPSSQARPSGGCQSGAGPRGALRAATWGRVLERRVRGEAGRPRAGPRPPSPPGAAPTPAPRKASGARRPQHPSPSSPTGAPARGSSARGLEAPGGPPGRGGASMEGRLCYLEGFYCVLATPRKSGRRGKVTAVHPQSEKSLPVSLLALGGAARAWRSRIVLIRASLCRRL